MNTKSFKTFPGYIVEHSYDHHVYVSKKEFDHYYGIMNLYGEASDEQVMTAILNLPADPGEDDDQITNTSVPVSLFRNWACDPAKTPVSKVANFITAAKLGILSEKEAQYADATFLNLLLQSGEYVAIECNDGSQAVLTGVDPLVGDTPEVRK